MIHEHNEIERKLDATGVDIDAFRRWCSDRLPEKYVFVNSPDYYYNQNGNVIRHRVNSETNHELTVKKRKSDKNTFDRLEIDLKFAPSTTAKDVEAFIKAVGFTLEFKLRKEAYIFWFQEGNTHLTVVVYDVFCEGHKDRRFIEVEAEKGSAVSIDHAKKRVNAWVKEIKEKFNLAGEPLNDSLYEIYTGKKYQTV
jgi:adenylate cyclase class IV